MTNETTAAADSSPDAPPMLKWKLVIALTCLHRYYVDYCQTNYRTLFLDITKGHLSPFEPRVGDAFVHAIRRPWDASRIAAVSREPDGSFLVFLEDVRVWDRVEVAQSWDVNPLMVRFFLLEKLIPAGWEQIDRGFWNHDSHRRTEFLRSASPQECVVCPEPVTDDTLDSLLAKYQADQVKEEKRKAEWEAEREARLERERLTGRPEEPPDVPAKCPVHGVRGLQAYLRSLFGG